MDFISKVDGGCGEGTSSRTLARAKAKVCAVDLFSEMISNALSSENSEPL
jgi:2-polyprenyl-3-methyl-5-hydroxy-6-metoxy-1,4-benzoquinol methylase